MALVRVEQRNAHLAASVRLATVSGREGPVAKATLTAISDTRKGSGDNRGDEATEISWTVWGKQAENAAQYLTKGSHVNVVGRVQNNNYEKDGTTVYAMAFTAEEIDYLDTKAEGDALRGKTRVLTLCLRRAALAVLALEVVVQARVLQRDRGLGGHDLQQLDSAGREDAGGVRVLEVDRRDRAARALQRHAQYRA